ncbi:MAG: hypothetical protein GY940_12295, partial [bacterium]|nr:hypothetical protein [bacterium]
MMNENSPLKPKPITLLLIAALTVSLLLSIVRNAKNDEVHYLTDSLQISDSLQTGQWIGNETVGFHGFLFKIPAALLFIITGPSVFAATLTNIVLALLSVYLSYLLLLHFLESPKWALAGSALVFTAIFFLRALASFKRDTAIVFALLLLLFLVVKKKNKWLIGLGLLLVLDAKESVFFMILPGFILWMIYSRFPESKRNNPRPQLRRGFGRFTAFFFPSILFLILMFTTPLVPLNPVAGKILGLNHGGFKTFLKDAFRPVKNNPLAPDDPDNITDGSGAGFRFFKMGDTAWWTDYAGEIERLAEFVTEEKLPVIKLTKPKGKSSHPSGGHVHIGRHLAKPARYAAGDYILFS